MTTPGTSGRARRVRRVLTGPAGRLAFSVAVVLAVFAYALPRIADYSEAWALVRGLSAAESAVLMTVAVANLLSYAPLWVAALPGLRWRDAVIVEESSTAISNTVPAGFAFGLGSIAAMFSSFGHLPGAIGRAIALTGVWNNLVKLAMPVFALLALTVTGAATGRLAGAAWVGVAVLATAVILLVLAVHSAGVARGLGRAAQRLAAPVLRALKRPPPSGWDVRADTFRAESESLVARRWIPLTVAAVVSHSLLFLVLLCCVRFVGGSEISWAELLAVFSLTRLVTLVPITPGALGVAELSYVAGLATIGVPAPAAAAAVLLFRFLTWFLPIPVGAACWLLWRRGAGRHHVPAAPALSRARP